MSALRVRLFAFVAACILAAPQVEGRGFLHIRNATKVASLTLANSTVPNGTEIETTATDVEKSGEIADSTTVVASEADGTDDASDIEDADTVYLPDGDGTNDESVEVDSDAEVSEVVPQVESRGFLHIRDATKAASLTRANSTDPNATRIDATAMDVEESAEIDDSTSVVASGDESTDDFSDFEDVDTVYLPDGDGTNDASPSLDSDTEVSFVQTDGGDDVDSETEEDGADFGAEEESLDLDVQDDGEADDNSEPIDGSDFEDINSFLQIGDEDL